MGGPGLTPYVPPHTESYYSVTRDPLVNPNPNPELTGDLMLSIKPKVVTDLFLRPFSQPCSLT